MSAPGKAVAVVLLLALQEAWGNTSDEQRQVWVGRYSTFWKNISSGETGLSAVGRNNFGQLGINTTLTPSCWAPVDIQFRKNPNPNDPDDAIHNVQDVVTGAFFTFFLTNRDIYGVGRNNHGQLGVGSTEDIAMPTFVMTANLDFMLGKHGDKRRTFACGYAHCIISHCIGPLCSAGGIGDDAGISSWGWNAQGQLGTGATADQLSPFEIPLEVGTIRNTVSAGHDFSMILVEILVEGSIHEDQLWVFGNNLGGQLGLGHRKSVLAPVSAGSWESFPYPDYRSALFALGNSHVLAQSVSAGMRGTGSNFAGQLGEGSTTPTDMFVDIPPFTGEQLRAGGDSSCFSNNSISGVWCTGDNTFGQIGHGSEPHSLGFSQVTQFGEESVVDLDTGSYHSMVVTVYTEGQDTTNRFLYGTGANGYGQLGDCGTKASNTFKSSFGDGESTNAPGEPTPAPPVTPSPQTTAAPSPEPTSEPPAQDTTSVGTKAPKGDEGSGNTTVLYILIAGGVVVAIACVLANTGNSQPDSETELP